MKNKKFNRDVAEKGLIELLELKLRNLDVNLEASNDEGTIRVCVDEYQMVREIARSIGMNTDSYEDRFMSKRDELKRYGVQIK